MKNKCWIFLAVLTAVAVFSSCKGNNSDFPKSERNFDNDASYALGMNVGAGLKDSMLNDGIIPNLDEFFRGMKDGMMGGKTRFDIDDARERINVAYEEMMQERDAGAMQEEIAFLAENAKKPGVTLTPNGLQYEVMVEGNGKKPSANDIVRVHYEGRLTNNMLFDNSYERGEPIEFALNEVITGWSEGLQLMSVGSKYKLYVPSEMGYGQYGNGPIPAYATLVFIVELLDIVEQGE
ncbi:MAG: FKBP-type peptidyl-prolyl cis-trans isomerase [Treponema sp.]|jgi:FKBP-type peptidyl-prolyl cis-trans isomerase|nr:FKBP-type peptidyl-prolyl cis-trans isomerase [Treponema sp.]